VAAVGRHRSTHGADVDRSLRHRVKDEVLASICRPAQQNERPLPEVYTLMLGREWLLICWLTVEPVK
jgi:hypothetical protein